MKVGAPWFFRRSISVGVAGILVAMLAACTGRGGGYLPPAGPVFAGPASFGFAFSCEDKGGVNPPTGQLRIELAYVEHGDNRLVGSRFSIHGTVDTIDPVLESAICIGQNPPPGGRELIFLGRYRPTTSAPAKFQSCPTRETETTPLCRFEVIVRDNDKNGAPSQGDFFSITLSNLTVPTADPTEFPAATVLYTRAGLLRSGNLTVH
jgi:hypothetical protein